MNGVRVVDMFRCSTIEWIERLIMTAVHTTAINVRYNTTLARVKRLFHDVQRNGQIADLQAWRQEVHVPLGMMACYPQEYCARHERDPFPGNGSTKSEQPPPTAQNLTCGDDHKAAARNSNNYNPNASSHPNTTVRSKIAIVTGFNVEIVGTNYARQPHDLLTKLHTTPVH